MGKLFGTDGIRGKANQDPITPEMAVRIGKAIASFFKNGKSNPRILISNDSRISANMLEAGLAAGICSMGVDAVLCGILPTPGVAWLTVAEKAAAGISVSASHNPYDDNGIKIFKSDGFKLSQEEETQLEEIILNKVPKAASTAEIGCVSHLTDSVSRYREFLASTVPSLSLQGLRIVIDCANGATSRIVSQLFTEMGAEATIISNIPDGKNINKNCGSEHSEQLKLLVVDTKANIGIAFDGDGDRLVVADERGEILSGDELLAIFAESMHRHETLQNHSVVSTVMSNIGLGSSLRKMGIKHFSYMGYRNCWSG